MMRLYFYCSFLLVVGTAFAQPARFESSEEFENPLQRMEWNNLRLCDPKSGSLPDNIRAQEVEFAKSLPVYAPPALFSAKGNANAIQARAPIQFHALGPTTVGGRTRAFAIDYANPNVFLTGSVSGGVWRSIDAGKTWTRVSPQNDIHNVSSLTQSLVNPKVWYMGTGEVLSTTDRRTSTNLRTIGTGTGVYRSEDGGITWSRITPPLVEQQPNNLQVRAQGVWKLLCVQPANGVDAVYAAFYGGIYVYLNNTWNPVIEPTIKPFSTDVVATPDAKTAYFAISSTEDGTKPEVYGIYRKEGSSYTNITPPGFPAQTRRIKMALAPSNKRILYVLTEAPQNWTLRYKNFTSLSTLWLYTADEFGNGGTWKQLSMAPLYNREYASLGGYAMTLAVHPTTPSVVFLGGTNLYRTRSAFLDTSDVLQVGGYPYIVEPGRSHPDIHNAVFHPQNPEKLFIACDGGIFSTDSCRTTSLAFETSLFWHSLNNGYQSTQCYHLTLDGKIPGDNFVMTGLQDNGSYFTQDSKGEKWSFVGRGDGTACQVLRNKEVIFGTWQYSNIYAFRLREGSIPEYSNFTQPNLSSTPQFITELLLDPAEQRALYLSAGRSIYIYTNPLRSMDTSLPHADLWQSISLVDTVLKGKTTTVISCLSGSVSPPDILAFGTSDGNVYLIKNILSSAATIHKITGTNFPINAFVSSVEIDPRDANKMVVSFSNYAVESIFYTSNGGTSWQSIAGNLENNPDGSGWGPSVRVVRMLPRANATTFLAGTSTGLYSMQSDDNFMTWTQEGISTIGNATVEALACRGSDGRIVVGTHGGGVYTGALDAATAVEEYTDTHFQLEQSYPQPFSSSALIYFTLPSEGVVHLDLYNSTGELIRTLLHTRLGAGRHSFQLEAKDLRDQADGIYFYRLQQGDKSSTRILNVVR